MDYFILTDTEFFRQVTGKKASGKLEAAYRDFINAIFDLCTHCSNRYELFFAMTYTEIELQSLCNDYRPDSGTNEKRDSDLSYLRKALSFIHCTLKQLQLQMPPLPVSGSNPASPISRYRWTGSVVELVEIIYGLNEMRSINNGETPITELAGFIGSQFCVEIKDCYSAYVDMKRRKNDSRTYYLDKMRERLNRRMESDDEEERRRK